MTFLPAALVRPANTYVSRQPEDKNPVFPRNRAPQIHVRGALLRYSTSTPPAKRR